MRHTPLSPNPCNPCNPWLKPTPTSDQISTIISLLQSAKRPALIVGSGVRNAKAEKLFLEVAESLNIPVLTSISGIDLIPSDHRLFFGRPGILGERPANFIMQNSDLFIVLGTRMGIRICGYAYETVARAAKKVMVDIDPNELEKPTFRPDVKICADAGDFLRALAAALPSLGPKAEWLDYCRRMKAKYPVILPEHRARTDYVSSYVLPEAIMRHAPDPLTVVTSNGIAYTSTFQAIPIRKGMRMFSNEACASMGYGLPAAIGAAFATPAPSATHPAPSTPQQTPRTLLFMFFCIAILSVVCPYSITQHLAKSAQISAQFYFAAVGTTAFVL